MNEGPEEALERDALYRQAPGEVSSEDLADRYRDGDDTAFVLLRVRYERAIGGYVYRMLEADSAAAAATPDIVQAILLRLMVALKGGKFKRTMGEFEPWLFVVVRNEVRTWGRKERKDRERRGPSLDDPLHRLLGVAEAAVPFEDIVLLRLLAAEFDRRLPPKLREVHLLWWQMGFGDREMATILNLGLSTVEKRKQRLRRRMRAFFARHLGLDEGDR